MDLLCSGCNMKILDKILKRKRVCVNCKNEYSIKGFSLDANKEKCNYCIKKRTGRAETTETRNNAILFKIH